ncbi:protein of unknown function [Rhodovastum atsumiense]|nr:protein of unknown function [Rhodovastum atsumiense]
MGGAWWNGRIFHFEAGTHLTPACADRSRMSRNYPMVNGLFTLSRAALARLCQQRGRA